MTKLSYNPWKYPAVTQAALYYNRKRRLARLSAPVDTTPGGTVDVIALAGTAGGLKLAGGAGYIKRAGA